MEKKWIPVAISDSSFMDYGCPKCGSIFGYYPVVGGGEGLWVCADCGATTLILSAGTLSEVLAGGNVRSSIGGISPQLVTHPREGLGKIDRAKAVKARVENIEEREFEELRKLIHFGYGCPVEVKTVSHHSSKSCSLPVVAVEKVDSNVKVAWFADNFHSHFLGMQFAKPVCASFLYPISGCLDELSYSGHVNDRVAAGLPHHIRASYNREMIHTLGLECGGISASIIIRYLHEISSLDHNKILGICYNEGREGGNKTFIHGNYVNFKSLLKAVDPGLKEEGYGASMTLPEDSIFEKVYVKEFSDISRHGSSVIVTMKSGSFLPDMPFPFDNVFANPSETALEQYLPESVQQRKLPGTYDDYVISTVSVKSLHYQKELLREPEWRDHTLHAAHCCLNKGFKTLIFDTPNLLDAVMTAVFLAKAVDPIARSYFKK